MNDLLYIHVLPRFESQHTLSDGAICVCEPTIDPTFDAPSSKLEVRVINHRPEGIHVVGVVHPADSTIATEQEDGSVHLQRPDEDDPLDAA